MDERLSQNYDSFLEQFERKESKESSGFEVARNLERSALRFVEDIFTGAKFTEATSKDRQSPDATIKFDDRIVFVEFFSFLEKYRLGKVLSAFGEWKIRNAEQAAPDTQFSVLIICPKFDIASIEGLITEGYRQKEGICGLVVVTPKALVRLRELADAQVDARSRAIQYILNRFGILDSGQIEEAFTRAQESIAPTNHAREPISSGHSSTFETSKFIEILSTEVKEVARKRYNGTSAVALGKAFQFWCIENISPSLSQKPNEVELARSICETGDSGDANIDGAWLDEEKRTFFLMQSKYSPPESNVYSEDFRVNAFGSQAAEELESGFNRLLHFSEDTRAVVPRKFLQLMTLYKQAVEKKLRIELIVAISGKPRKALFGYAAELNARFRKDPKFAKIHMSIYDVEVLNQIYSDKWGKPPGPVYLAVSRASELQNPDGSIYAIAATVTAKELVRIRDECNYSIYHSNFRFVITGGKGVARPKIEKTLGDPEERRNFWRYNNGITISCSNAKSSNANNTKYRIENLQVVNGLQTIETLWENRDRKWLTDDVRLLVRIIPTASESPEKSRLLEEHIAEYSNSQTPITPRDLRANDPVQQEIERLAWEVYDIKYIRKVGQISGALGRPTGGREKVDNEDAAQAALSFWFGQSWEAKSKRKVLFELSTSATPGFYDKLFTPKTTAEYILLPSLLWEFEYKFIDSVHDKIRRGVYRGTDLLAMAVFGEAFRDIFNLPATPSSSEAVTRILRSAIFNLQNIRMQENKTAATKCWKPILDSIFKVVESRRQIQAREQDSEEDEISYRNVYVKLKYTEPELRKEINKFLNSKVLKRTIQTYLSSR